MEALLDLTFQWFGDKSTFALGRRICSNIHVSKEWIMRLNAHLEFNGQCEAAFEFYEKCLGGKILMMMRYEDSPLAGQAPPGWGKKVIHATFELGGHVLTGADALPVSYQK